MDETDLNQIVNAWIAAEDAGCGSPEHEANWWAFEQLTDWFREDQGEFVWRFITAAYKRELSDRVFGALAAGPLEDLLAEHERIPGLTTCWEACGATQ